jgi:hypothetical protein
MVAAVKRWGIGVVLSAVGLVLAVGPARAQNTQCPQGSSPTQLTAQQELTVLKTALQDALQRLNTLQQNGQLTAAEQRVVSRLQTDLSAVLQQLNALPANGQLTAAQRQSVRQLLNALLPNRNLTTATRTTPVRARR